MDRKSDIMPRVGRWKNAKPMTRLEEADAFRRYHNGDKNAFDEIVERNIPLVVLLANRFTRHRDFCAAVDVSDYFQAGIEGLVRAVEMFDASRGFKFSTYAHRWIRSKMQREREVRGSTIRIPVHVITALKYVSRNSDFDIGDISNVKKVSDVMEARSNHVWNTSPLDVVKAKITENMISIDFKTDRNGEDHDENVHIERYSMRSWGDSDCEVEGVSEEWLKDALATLTTEELDSVMREYFHGEEDERCDSSATLTCAMQKLRKYARENGLSE